ncbi:MAG: hypothetical protein MUP13_03085 [Thermoanaerobaculales bacterium]|nr:hypothetical protein [Thermoanaerobaculales bacterium]
MTRPRYSEPAMGSDLQRKMVFKASPRHVGKTTLATRILERWPVNLYLNWDNHQRHFERYPVG